VKYKYAIKKGDLIFNSVTKKTCLVTKTTEHFYYYIFSNCDQVNRSSLWRTWHNIDRDLSGISYGKMKNRKKQRKIRTLDLHGIKHEKADELIRQFLNFVELPCTIITGNSKKMKEIVSSIVDEYDWICGPKSENSGSLTVMEK
tara:strand:- start:10 stop:441 length:432 start_codon:yes stop_codon:yes gene_type:complete